MPGQLFKSAEWIILLFQLFNSTSNWELTLECEGREVISCFLSCSALPVVLVQRSMEAVEQSPRGEDRDGDRLEGEG